MNKRKRKISLIEARPDLAMQWHPTRNGELTPADVTPGSTRKVWWLLPYDDPETRAHFDFEWKATISSRASGAGCPFLSGRAAWPGYNDLATKRPDLAMQWHPTKNGDLRPEDVTEKSVKQVWWLLPYDDPETRAHFDFEWEAIIHHRANGVGCPYLFGKAVWPGYNDLATKRPDLAKEWHPTKNGELRPEDVTEKSNKRVWWLLPYDDPETGEHHVYEWMASISSRVRGAGYPYMA